MDRRKRMHGRKRRSPVKLSFRNPNANTPAPTQTDQGPMAKTQPTTIQMGKRVECKK
jgi:hypothetical protein